MALRRVSYYGRRSNEGRHTERRDVNLGGRRLPNRVFRIWADLRPGDQFEVGMEPDPTFLKLLEDLWRLVSLRRAGHFSGANCFEL